MIDVVVLTSTSCHLCEDALAALEELSAEFPLTVRAVELDSPEGRRLFELHRPPVPPAILVDGALFSSGRLPRKKLRRFLERAV